MISKQDINDMEAELLLAKFEYAAQNCLARAIELLPNNVKNDTDFIKNAPLFINEITIELVRLLDKYKHQ